MAEDPINKAYSAYSRRMSRIVHGYRPRYMPIVPESDRQKLEIAVKLSSRRSFMRTLSVSENMRISHRYSPGRELEPWTHEQDPVWLKLEELTAAIGFTHIVIDRLQRELMGRRMNRETYMSIADGTHEGLQNAIKSTQAARPHRARLVLSDFPHSIALLDEIDDWHGGAR